eukprot:1638138-Rhodomonas_salina.1
MDGCEVDRTKEKDEIVVIGNSRENVGTSVSKIQQICQVSFAICRNARFTISILTLRLLRS